MDANLTSSLEDYLEVISNYLKKYNKVRAIDISKELNVSRASVSEALKRLSKQGLINYGRYDAITITEEGEKIAHKVIKKHTLLQEFFSNVLGLEEQEATENACKIEHIISENVFERLYEYIEYNKQHPEFAKEFCTKFYKINH